MSGTVKVLLVSSDAATVQSVKSALTGRGSPAAARIRQDFLKRFETAHGTSRAAPRWSLMTTKSIDAASDGLESIAETEAGPCLIVLDGEIDQHEQVLLFMLTVQAISEQAHIVLIARGGGGALRRAIEELGDGDRCSYLRRPASTEEIARSLMFVAWRSLMTANIRNADERGFAGVGAADLAGAMLVENEAEQRRMAVQDTLTRLGNRRLFDATLAEVCALRADQRDRVLMLIDLDCFKAVNDTLGHAAGDALLQQVADRLRVLVGPNDMVFRLGGDEFALIKSDIEGAQELAESVIASMCKPFEVLGQPARIGASVGWALPDLGDAKPEQWTARADMALYAAKGAGRGVAIRYSEDQDRRRQARESLESRVKDHISMGPAPLLFAPIVEAQSGALWGSEAVLALSGDELADLTEARLDTLIGDSKLALELAFWIVSSAIQSAAGFGNGFISINLTARVLNSELLLERILQQCGQFNVPPGRLVLEAPSTSIFANVDMANGRIKALKKAGLSVIIDDFGVGPFSIEGLLRLQVDGVKLSASLSKEASGSAGALRIMSGVAAIASGAGVRVAAAGADDEQLLLKMSAMGCGRVQGRAVSGLLSLQQLRHLMLADTLEAGPMRASMR
jgi:diguanylate cyclase (GGDEF)-like protein